MPQATLSQRVCIWIVAPASGRQGENPPDVSEVNREINFRK